MVWLKWPSSRAMCVLWQHILALCCSVVDIYARLYLHRPLTFAIKMVIRVQRDEYSMHKGNIYFVGYSPNSRAEKSR